MHEAHTFVFINIYQYIARQCPVQDAYPTVNSQKQSTLLWRHNGCDGVWNHQPHDCLLSRSFRRRSKKTSKTPRHWPVTRKMFSFDDVIMHGSASQATFFVCIFLRSYIHIFTQYTIISIIQWRTIVCKAELYTGVIYEGRVFTQFFQIVLWSWIPNGSSGGKTGKTVQSNILIARSIDISYDMTVKM